MAPGIPHAEHAEPLRMLLVVGAEGGAEGDASASAIATIAQLNHMWVQLTRAHLTSLSVQSQKPPGDAL